MSESKRMRSRRCDAERKQHHDAYARKRQHAIGSANLNRRCGVCGMRRRGRRSRTFALSRGSAFSPRRPGLPWFTARTRFGDRIFHVAMRRPPAWRHRAFESFFGARPPNFSACIDRYPVAGIPSFMRIGTKIVTRFRERSIKSALSCLARRIDARVRLVQLRTEARQVATPARAVARRIGRSCQASMWHRA